MFKKFSYVNPRDYCKFVSSTPYPPLGIGYLAAVLRQNGYVDEMQDLREKYDLDDIFFYDDLFVCNRKRVIEVCEEILKRGLKLTWSAQARVDRIDLEVLYLMKKAGCDEVYFGVESGSN